MDNETDRPTNRWTDSLNFEDLYRLTVRIREWTGLEFAKSQRSVENREKWRKRIVKSSVEPQRPSRLRDR